MSQQLRILYTRVERLRGLYHRALKATTVLKSFEEFQDDHLHSHELAADHKRLFLAYNNFFDPVKDALLLDAHIQLCKMFIENENSLHLKKLLRYARSEDNKLAKESMLENFHDSIADFGSWYNHLTSQDFAELKIKIEVNEWLIQKLELVRNKKLGHEDINDIPAEMLTSVELNKLINLAHDILGSLTLIYGGYDPQGYNFENVEQETVLMLNKLYTTY